MSDKGFEDFLKNSSSKAAKNYRAELKNLQKKRITPFSPTPAHLQRNVDIAKNVARIAYDKQEKEKKILAEQRKKAEEYKKQQDAAKAALAKKQAEEVQEQKEEMAAMVATQIIQQTTQAASKPAPAGARPISDSDLAGTNHMALLAAAGAAALVLLW